MTELDFDDDYKLIRACSWSSHHLGWGRLSCPKHPQRIFCKTNHVQWLLLGHSHFYRGVTLPLSLCLWLLFTRNLVQPCVRDSPFCFVLKDNSSQFPPVSYNTFSFPSSPFSSPHSAMEGPWSLFLPLSLPGKCPPLFYISVPKCSSTEGHSFLSSVVSSCAV